MKPSQSLFDLRPGDTGIITGYATRNHESARLRSLGLVEGEIIRIVRFAPFGDPVEIKVRGFYLSLDKSTAEGVHVQQNINDKIEKTAA